MPVFALKGAIQHYDWGGMEFISNLIGIANAEQQPFAELWMGTHPRGMSTIFTEEESIALADFIARDAVSILGEKVIAQFGEQLPFLLKILDVKKMLSIQTHPTKAQAVVGFQQENEKGIPLDASYRNFKDDNHKPEMMVALTDFWLLHGFKSVEAITATFEQVEELYPLKQLFEQQDIRQLYQYLMELPQTEVDRILQPLEERLFWGIYNDKSHPDHWAKLAFEDYTQNGHFDRGIFSIYLFNIVHVQPNQGVFQDAGIPHAYLQGVCVELMANSDNVFRGGLTPKHIDVPVLMQHIITTPVVPAILNGTQVAATEIIYETPAPDFELSRKDLTKNSLHLYRTASPSIFIVTSGAVKIESEGQFLSGNKGDIFFTTAESEYAIVAALDSVVFQAMVGK